MCVCTPDVALVVVLLQQATVVGQLFLFVRMSDELGPRGGAAALLRERPEEDTPIDTISNGTTSILMTHTCKLLTTSTAIKQSCWKRTRKRHTYAVEFCTTQYAADWPQSNLKKK